MNKILILFFLLSLGLSLMGQSVPNKFGTMTIVSADIANDAVDSTDLSPQGGSNGDVLTIRNGNVVMLPPSYDLFSTTFELDEDFIGGKEYEWQGVPPSISSDDFDQHPGIGGLSSDPTGGGDHFSYLGSTQVYLYPSMRFEMSFYAHGTFQTSTDSTMVGLGGAGDNEAVFFIFKPNQQIKFMVINAGVPSSIDTGFSFDVDGSDGSPWTRAGFVVNSNATSVECFINGVSGGSISTNLPNGVTDWMRPQIETVTTTGGEFEFDYYRLRIPNLNR